MKLPTMSFAGLPVMASNLYLASSRFASPVPAYTHRAFSVTSIYTDLTDVPGLLFKHFFS